MLAIPILLEALAPSIAKLFGTKLESYAIQKLESTLQTKDVNKKLTELNDSETKQLKELDNEIQLILAQVQDISNARNREIQVKDKIPAFLAIFITLGFFGILALYAYGAIPETNLQILNIMTGSLGTAWVSIIGYYFGSSIGSKQKTELLSKP